MGVRQLGAIIVTCDKAGCDERDQYLHPLGKVEEAEALAVKGAWSLSGGQVMCPVHAGTHVRFFGAVVPLKEQPRDRCYWTIPGEECEHLRDGDRDDVWGHEELYQADRECRHRVVSAPGGGVKCVKCPGWFCY